MNWALIEETSVKEITDIDPKNRFHSSLLWVECPETTKVGMVYVNGTFKQPASVKVPLTKEVVENLRLLAYADPLTGSDRLFLEASRMQMMEEDGWEAVKDLAVTRYQQIQNEHPWP